MKDKHRVNKITKEVKDKESTIILLLNSKYCRHYKSSNTIQGRKLFAEIRYSKFTSSAHVKAPAEESDIPFNEIFNAQPEILISN